MNFEHSVLRHKFLGQHKTMESLQNAPNLLELCQNDLDLAIEAVDNLVKKVSHGKQENHT